MTKLQNSIADFIYKVTDIFCVCLMRMVIIFRQTDISDTKQCSGSLEIPINNTKHDHLVLREVRTISASWFKLICW